MLALTSVSFAALAAGTTPAFAASQGAPIPESCANIADEAAKQACADAAEQVDPNANAGEQATTPTQGAVASAEASSSASTEIVVTGSRLRRDERTSADPLTVIDPNVENREGRFDTAEILQTSPIAAGSTQITTALSSNFVINGGEGVSTISLRGLGANRTLVLLNGRRAGPSGTRGGVSAFDLNVIPQDVIQTVEIVKTGASSVYGSDAIAGVVNLITKKDLRGLQLRATGQLTDRSGGESYSLSGSYGLGLGDRGHLMLAVNYQKQNELEQRDRDYLGCSLENATLESTGARSDPIDPRTGEFWCNGFNSNYISLSDFGIINGSNLYGPCLPLSPTATTNGGGRAAFQCSNAAGTRSNRRGISVITFDPSLGQYLTNENGLFFCPVTGTCPGFTVNPSQFVAPAGFFPVGAHTNRALTLLPEDEDALGDSVIPKSKRFTVYGEAGYDLTDDVNLYFEGLYNRRQTQTDATGQLFFSQFPGTATTIFTEFYGPAPYPFDYYLPYFFCEGGASGTVEQCNPSAQGDPFNAGFSGGALLTPVTSRPFSSSADVKYMRGTAGIHANLDSVLPKGFVDFYYQYAKSDGDYNRVTTFRDAVEFGVAEFRTQSCVGTLTAIRGIPCIDIDYTDPRILAGDFTAEERAFLFTDDNEGNTTYTQNVAELVFGGDLFELPGGPVKFALGAHWRRDKINDVPGPVTLANNVWGATVAGITAGYQTTKEAFGEIELPLLRDLPMVHELTLNGAARVTNTKAVRKFDGASDTDKNNWTYKVAANWSPVRPVRLRATYGTSFRSPALFEQFLNNETGFLAQSQVDPCIQWGNEDNELIRESCEAVGIPDDYSGAGSSAQTNSQGNVGQLDPETSRAFTLGAIFTPDSWLWDGGQFSLAIDYIDIKVKDQVTQLGGNNIPLICHASETYPDDPRCDLFQRDLNPNSATAWNITVINDPYFNIDTQHNKSIDVTARFRQNLGNMGSLSLLGQMTFQTKDRFLLFQDTPINDNGEVGDPKWVGTLNATWTKRPFTVTYGLQVIAGTNDLADLQSAGGSATTANNCFGTATGYQIFGGPYCPIYKLPRVAYHSLSAEYEINRNFSVLAGVSNLFDREPPQVSLRGSISGMSIFTGNTPINGTYYDFFGRRFFVSVRAKLNNLGLPF